MYGSGVGQIPRTRGWWYRDTVYSLLGQCTGQEWDRYPGPGDGGPVIRCIVCWVSVRVRSGTDTQDQGMVVPWYGVSSAGSVYGSGVGQISRTRGWWSRDTVYSLLGQCTGQEWDRYLGPGDGGPAIRCIVCWVSVRVRSGTDIQDQGMVVPRYGV